MIPFLEANTEPGALIGMTGGGNVGYLMPSRTIVNMDGLINSYEYFEALQAGTGADYLYDTGLRYVFANPTLLEANPYRGQYSDRLEVLVDWGGKDLLRLLPKADRLSAPAAPCMRRKRYPLPARITLALVLVLITAAWNLMRVWAGLALAPALQKYAPWPGPALHRRHGRRLRPGWDWQCCGASGAEARWAPTGAAWRGASPTQPGSGWIDWSSSRSRHRLAILAPDHRAAAGLHRSRRAGSAQSTLLRKRGP